MNTHEHMPVASRPATTSTHESWCQHLHRECCPADSPDCDCRAVCEHAAEHPLMLSCGSCDYLSRSVRELIAEELTSWADDLDGITGARWIADAARERAARMTTHPGRHAATHTLSRTTDTRGVDRA